MAALSLIPWKDVEADPRWAEAPTYLRDEYLAKWESANLERVGTDVALANRIKDHAKLIRSELYPSEIRLSERAQAFTEKALEAGATSEQIAGAVPASQIGDVAGAIGAQAEQVRAARRKIVEDLNAEFTKAGRSHRAKLTEDNGDGILRIDAPVIPGTESDDEPQYDIPPEVDQQLEKAANRLKGHNLQLMRMGVFKPPSGIKEEYRDLPFGGVLSTQLMGGIALQTAGVLGMLRDFAGQGGAKPGDLEAALASVGSVMKEAAGAPEGAGSSIARGAGTVGSLIGPGGFTTAALRAASEAYESTLVATGDEKEARAAALKTAPAMLLFFGAGRFAGNMSSRLAGPDATALTRGLFGFGGAEVANIGASSVLRALDAPDGEALQAAKPTIETLTVDTLFAAMHGFGDYGNARSTARARAEAELRRRGFTKEQFEDWYFANMKRAGVPKGKEAPPAAGERVPTPAERIVPEGETPAPVSTAPSLPAGATQPPAEPPTPRQALQARITDLEAQLKTEVENFGESETSEHLRSQLDASINELGTLTTTEETPPPDVEVVSQPEQVTPTPEPATVEAPQPARAEETPAPAATPAEPGPAAEGAIPDINTIVPAIPVNGETVPGKPGETHRQILDRWKEGKTDEEKALAEMDFDRPNNQNFFVDAAGNKISREQLEKWFGARSSQELAAKQKPPAAVEPPKPQPLTRAGAELAAKLDAQRGKIERLADYKGGDIQGFDPELAAAKAITDVLGSIKPDADQKTLESALTNRIGQIVEDARRAAKAEKRGGGEPTASMDEEGSAASQVPDVAPSSKPDRQTPKRELQNAIAEEAAKLDVKDRTILFGIQEGQNLSEIARSLGISPAAAQKRWDKVQTRMQARLAKFKGEAGAILNPLGPAFARGRITPTPVTSGSVLVEPYARGRMTRALMRGWLGKFGAFPPEMRETLRRGGYKEKAIEERFRALASDLSAALDDYAGGDQARRDAAMELVSRYEEGDAAAYNRLPTQRLKDTAWQNRAAMDSVTEALVEEGAVPAGPLANAMIGNVGAWMRRYYAAFDSEANWNLDALRERAAGTGPDAVRTQRILDNAENHIRQDHLNRGLPQPTPTEMEAILRGLTDRSELQAAMFGGGGSKIRADISSYVKRENIPAPIRALMGEERNPILKIEKSGGFLAQAITRHRMQQQLRVIGLQTGAFSLRREGRYAVEVPHDSPGRSPWRGLYTTPEFAAAMREAQLYGEGVGTATKFIDRVFRAFVGEVKFNLVAMNPRSWIVNAAGGGVQSVFNGMFVPIPGTGAPIIKTLMKSYRAILRGDKPFDPTRADADFRQASRNMFQELQSQGLVDSSVTLQDWESSVSDGLNLSNASEAALDRLLGAGRGLLTGYASGLASTGSRIGGAVGAAVGTAGGAALGAQRMTRLQRRWGQFIIGSPDSFWKSVNFLQNFAQQVRKGTLSLRESADLAGLRTRQTMPSYDQIPQALRQLASRVPGVNVFFQFSWELMRNNVNNARIAYEDLTSSNPVDRKHGARRLLGIVMGTAAVAAALEWARAKFGWTDKKEQAFRRSFAPPWDKNGVLAPVQSMEGGTASYINSKYLIPQMQFGEIFKAFTEGKSAEDTLKKAWQTMTDDFVRSNAAVDPALEAISGKRADTGKPISSEEPGSLASKWDAFDHFMKRIAPGIAQEAGKMRMAITGEQAGYGRKYTMTERLQGLMGLRTNTYDIKQQLSFRLSDMDRQWNEISKKENTELKRIAGMKGADPGAYAERSKTIKETADRQRGELQLKAVQLYADAFEVGLTSGDVAKAMNDKRTKLPLELRNAYIARKLREQGKEVPATVEELRAFRRGE